MDADGWDRSDAPRAMTAAAGGRVSARKWRLFLAAAVRDARRHHLVPAVVDAVSLAERHADGLIDDASLTRAWQAVRHGWRDTDVDHLLAPTQPGQAGLNAARAAGRLDRIDADPARRALWLREVVGNPFRWVRWEDEWVTRTVHALATTAYAEGRFDTLPVLADALDDAGCDNAELLAHLRGPGPHARGCWALDVVLGKV